MPQAKRTSTMTASQILYRSGDDYPASTVTSGHVTVNGAAATGNI